MTFTEDDLKRLKEIAADTNDIMLYEFSISALIARLEAAEEALEIYEENFHGYDDESLAAVKAWREAAGK